MIVVKIVMCFWFDCDGEDVVMFYCLLIFGLCIIVVSRYGKGDGLFGNSL